MPAVVQEDATALDCVGGNHLQVHLQVKKDKSSRKAKPNTSVNMEPAGSRQPGGHRSTLAAAAGSNKAEVMPRPGTKRSLSDRLQSKV